MTSDGHNAPLDAEDAASLHIALLRRYGHNAQLGVQWDSAERMTPIVHVHEPEPDECP